jgi:thiol-disulfide isomerase/thioredoxin
MKKILLCSLLLSSLVAFADDPAPATNGSSASGAASASDDKAGAIAIRDMLIAIYKSGSIINDAWDAAEAKLQSYQKDYGVTPETTGILVQLRNMQLMVAKKLGDDARYNALLQKLTTDPVPEVAAMASDVVTKQKQLDDLKSKPMDLKFTAVDGTAINLADMRGKVVLIDFWATWCPPCREEVPDVVAAYQKYHDKGFEIVGISLDQDKDKLLAYTKEKGMLWPQYFDGLGWDNNVSKSFGINSIPAMWLVDKKGMLVTTDGREDLAGQVDKLLAAP